MDKFIIKEKISKFIIKQVGSPGPKGDDGDASTIALGTVEQGDTASITNTGDEHNAIFNFVLPKGDKGDAGDSSTLQNIGDGEGIFKETIGSIAYLKTLKSLTNSLSIISEDDTVNIDISNLDTQITNINTQIETLNQSVSNIDSELVGINSTVNSINNSITQINIDINNLGSNITTINNQITDINNQLTILNNRITAVESKVLPTGGGTGQVLVKKSNTDYDTEWKTPAGNDENIFTCIGWAVNSGFTTNNNTWNGIGLATSYINGQADSPTPAWTSSLYDGRARNLYRTTDNPTNTSTTSYYSQVFIRYVGTTSHGGFKGAVDLCFETNNDPLSKFFFGEISTFIGVPNISSGPSNLINCIGFGFDSADTSFSVYINSSSGTATKLPVSSFSGNLIASDYQARVIKRPILLTYDINPGGTIMIFTFTDLISGRTGTLTVNNPTKKPASNTPLRPMINITAGTAGLSQMDGVAIYNYKFTKPLR